MNLRTCMLLLLLSGPPAIARAQQDRAPVEPQALPAPDQVVEAVKPVIEKTGEHTFCIGKITSIPVTATATTRFGFLFPNASRHRDRKSP